MEDLRRSWRKPLFGSTFSPKKTPPRRSASLSSLHTLDHISRELELGIDCGAPETNIGGHLWKFEDGQWIDETVGTGSARDMLRLKKRNLQLEEENNLLKLKIEVLLDMLTETTVEYHLMEREVEDTKIRARRKKQLL